MRLWERKRKSCVLYRRTEERKTRKTAEGGGRRCAKLMEGARRRRGGRARKGKSRLGSPRMLPHDTTEEPACVCRASPGAARWDGNG